MFPYIPNTKADQSRMLEFIGVKNIDELVNCIPDDLRLKASLHIPGPMSEIDLARYAADLGELDANSRSFAYFLGAGIYDHYIPSTVPAIIGRSEFYTSYTPYQPELSQGNLQATFEFQTLICQLTEMEVANASMYDGATALAEAALMATAVTNRKEWVVSGCVHPAYLDVMRTYAWASGHNIVESQRSNILTDIDDLSRRVTEDTACVIMQSPNFFGAIELMSAAEKIAHSVGAIFIVCFDPISLGLMKPPGDLGADICVGEGQPLGIAMGYGGPLLGLFACKREYIRQMPGRVVGATTDTEGRRGYTLTLQTREQHIRRERATSNICTNEALNALAATVYLATLGQQGLRNVANLCLQKAHYAAERIAGIPGYSILGDARFFKEFLVKCERPVAEINEQLLSKGIMGGLDMETFYPDLAGHMLLCVTEKRTKEEIDSLVEGLSL